MEHLIKRHPNRRFIAQHDHTQTIADEDERNTGFVDYLGRGIVISRNHGDFLTSFFHVLNLADSNAHMASLFVPGIGRLFYRPNTFSSSRVTLSFLALTWTIFG